MRAFEFLDDIEKIDTKTMVIDKNLSYNNAKEILEVSSNYFNLMKFGWGTSVLFTEQQVKDKNELYHSYDIKTYPGGTLFEVANMKDKVDEYFDQLDKLGFNAVEISNGSTEISPERRQDVIRKAKDLGFYTLSEVGKKDPNKDHEYNDDDRIKLIKTDIENGSDIVIIEGRESGKNIGIYDNKGNVNMDSLTYIQENTPQDKILWEAPQKNQQIDLILTLGNDVNLGNINTNDIISLETLRRGLRGDTVGKI